MSGPLRDAYSGKIMSRDSIDRPAALIGTSAAPRAFALKFILYFALLFGAFEASRGSAFERFVVENMILVPTTALINAATPEEHATLVGRVISSPGSNLNVTRGCEGIEMFLLLAAGIGAFPASWKRRAQGLLIGTIVAYALSVARLMALHYILRYSPSAWEALHGLVLPLGPIILMALFFMHWSACAVGSSVNSEARAA
jgi:exosortase family protein XrtM